MANEHKTYELVVQPREITGKQSKQLRREDLVPGVVYGNEVKAESIQVLHRELDRVYLHAGSNTLVDLKIGDTATPRKVFIHNVQRNPVSHNLTHVDFMVVNLLEEITTTVQLVLTGESPAVKNGDGVLLQALDHIQIRALPSDILPLIEVDTSVLDDLDKTIHVSDLAVPGNVTVLTSGDELVAKVTALRAEPEEEVEAEEAAAEIAEGAEEGASGPEEES